MSKVESIEREIIELSATELATFRNWFRAFDAEAWDRQIEEDLRSGKLDGLANDALKSFQTEPRSEL